MKLDMIPKQFFAHRINTTEKLLSVPQKYGIEVDIRSNGSDLILHHDPFSVGENFVEFLLSFNHAGIILNTKEEGLENELISLMERYSIKNYFFLDLSLPFLIRTAKNGCNKIAVRFSEYEPIEFVEQLKGIAEWVWVDCFSGNVLTPESYNYLKQFFKICIVSPELHGHSISLIAEFKECFSTFEIDAICTKQPNLWT